MTNIFLADDHQMVIDGLKALLAGESEINIVGEALDGRAATEKLHQLTEHVDIIILDINMPGMDGIETTRYLRKNFPQLKILVLSMYNKPFFIQQLIAEGVSGYVLKNTGKDDLLTAIRKLMSGSDYFSPEVTRTMMSSFKTAAGESAVNLTRREIEILKLLAKGDTSSVISEKLFISTYTVDTHRKNILGKLNLKNTAALVRYAIDNGYAAE